VTTDFGQPISPPTAQQDRAPSACEPYRELIEQGLGRGRNAVAIWQDLVSDHGFPRRYRIPSEKISRIFNPLDLSEWKPGPRHDARRKLGIPDTTRVALWHGRIDIRTKGLDVLLEAWKVVCSQRSEGDILLMLVGSGNGSDMLDEEIHRTAAPHIRWIRDYVGDARGRSCDNRKPASHRLQWCDRKPFAPRREYIDVRSAQILADLHAVQNIFDEGEKSGGLVVPVGDVASLSKKPWFSFGR